MIRKTDFSFSGSVPFKRSRDIMVGVALSITMFASGPAIGACTDPPRPEVNWERCYMEERNFSGVDLSGALLRDARFHRSTLDGSNLSVVRAHRAKFISASLPETTFDHAHLTESDFTKANLQDASLANADLRRTRFFRANLRGADLSNARLTGADFLNADLSGATWVDGKTVCAEGSIGQCR